MLQKAVISSFLLLRGFLPATATAQEPAKRKAEAEQPPPPSCMYCPNPDFPAKARKAKISSARAVLEITVLEKGNVDPHDILVIQDPGNGFAEKAVAGVKKWKFKPATDKNGKPVKARIPVDITWHWIGPM